MAALAEKEVQRWALGYLRKRYRPRLWRGKVFAQQEMWTRRKYGGKRADGLVAFRHWLLGTYVVSMEAKSVKTLTAITPASKMSLLLKNSLWMGISICLLSGAALAFWRLEDGWLQYAIPLNIMVISGLVYAYFSRNSAKHQSLNVIQQIRQYPANEQWLAFSKDSYAAVSTQNQKRIHLLCRQEGIGILMVNKRGKVEELLLPKRRWKWIGDFLKYYSREEQIRKLIS